MTIKYSRSKPSFSNPLFRRVGHAETRIAGSGESVGTTTVDISYQPRAHCLGEHLVPRTRVLAFGFCLFIGGPALAQTAPNASLDTTAETIAPVAPPKPPPYSLPWGLRPALAVNVVRLDSVVSFFKNPVTQDSGSTFVSTLLASYKVTENISPMLRIGMASNSPPDGPMGANPGSGSVFLNPVLGINYSHKVDSFRFTPFLGVALPLGTGGGNTPDPALSQARADGILARSAMDNAMFAVNDLVIFPGLAFSYINHGVTFQLEATVLKLTQVRGDERAQADKSRTNVTAGAHIGYFIIPQLSFGVEVRHQRWLSNPVSVGLAPKTRDNTTFAFGPRAHIKLGETMWLRPGISFSTPLDDPMEDREQKTIQLDIPFLY